MRSDGARALGVLVAALVLVVGCRDEDMARSSSAVATASSEQVRAAAKLLDGRELTDTGDWFNSEPLTIAGELAQNRAVLIDFWTYTCVNCIRTLPYLRAWHERYSGHGLTVIGVHTPEFAFEQQRSNVLGAVQRYGLEYPVVQDNEYGTWDAFNNRFWPAKYLVVPGRGLVYSHFGEGQYEDTELAIRAQLERLGYSLADVPFVEVSAPRLDLDRASLQTAELYGGYRQNYAGRGYAGQQVYYLGPDMSQTYVDTGERAPNKWYLQGEWLNEAESVLHNRTTTDFEDYIALRFRAMAVNVVLHPEGKQPFEVVVELDGQPLQRSEAGADVTFREDGRSVLLVTEPRLYEVVSLPDFAERDLKLRANSRDFAVNAFTFGTYEPPS